MTHNSLRQCESKHPRCKDNACMNPCGPKAFSFAQFTGWPKWIEWTKLIPGVTYFHGRMDLGKGWIHCFLYYKKDSQQRNNDFSNITVPSGHTRGYRGSPRLDIATIHWIRTSQGHIAMILWPVPPTFLDNADPLAKKTWKLAFFLPLVTLLTGTRISWVWIWPFGFTQWLFSKPCPADCPRSYRLNLCLKQFKALRSDFSVL